MHICNVAKSLAYCISFTNKKVCLAVYTAERTLTLGS